MVRNYVIELMDFRYIPIKWSDISLYLLEFYLNFSVPIPFPPNQSQTPSGVLTPFPNSFQITPFKLLNWFVIRVMGWPAGS